MREELKSMRSKFVVIDLTLAYLWCKMVDCNKREETVWLMRLVSLPVFVLVEKLFIFSCPEQDSEPVYVVTILGVSEEWWAVMGMVQFKAALAIEIIPKNTTIELIAVIAVNCFRYYLILFRFKTLTPTSRSLLALQYVEVETTTCYESLCVQGHSQDCFSTEAKL